jgi:hypothetical protein
LNTSNLSTPLKRAYSVGDFYKIKTSNASTLLERNEITMVTEKLRVNEYGNQIDKA